MNLLRCLLTSLTMGSALLAAMPAVAQEKIRLGILPFSESLGAVMADKLGYFKSEGIEVEMTRFNSGALALPLVQAGKLDIAFSNTVATLQAMEQGLDITFIAAGAVVRDKAPDSTAVLMALKGAIKSPKDLEGKRIAVNAINSSLWLYVVAYLDHNGVDRAKVRFVEIPFPQMRDPLLNKQVDVAGVSEPFATILLDSGLVDPFDYVYVDAQPGADITQYIAATAWAEKNPGLAAKFARAVRKGSEFVNDPSNNAAVREANMQFTNLQSALKDRVILPRMGADVNLAAIGKTQELMLKYGMLKHPVDLKSAHILSTR